MLLDFGDISAALKPLLDAFLDHHHLNETTGLHNPTSEAIARWIYERLEAVLQIAQEVGQWSDGRHTVEHEGTVQVNIADTTALEVAQLFLPHEIEAALRKLPEPATENS
jgi:6-pyruvoyl-tetrahydropterin synthase